MQFFDHPDPFLEIRVHELDLTPGVTGLCVGYESDKWRVKQFVEHVMEWLPECTLNYSELQQFASGTGVKQIREAAKRVYESEAYAGRGEFGELFLHIALRQVFKSVPAVAKLYFKSATNDTVKGFDAVHVVSGDKGLELWLGEVKFYEDGMRAIRDVVSELRDHLDEDYLRTEFMLLKSKVDPNWPGADAFQALIRKNASLDQIFSSVCIPVLVTYDSTCLTAHKQANDAYIEAFKTEIQHYYDAFAKKDLPKKVRVHLFLLPLNTKKLLIKELHDKLKAWQAI